ncbi:MAG: YeeE/YedE family protein [Rhodobacterales bacterium]|nr:YeeE/YedE family protein [Rhodobacterales bacterium]
MRLLSALVIGLIFGTGIAVSGMINPAKVLNFFDLAGTWDPSLAFVMAGALAVAIPGYRLVLAGPGPTFEPRFQLPDTRLIDRRLILGSITFGIGWGIAGFCPGGALPAIGTGDPAVFLFLVALIGGMLIARALQSRAQTRKPA